MRAEIISIGTELLLGHTINSDAAIVARMLAELGIDALNMQTVGDNPQRLKDALQLAASRSDLIVTTGGLGPTDDDLSKTTVAEFAGVPLVEYPEALAQLKEYFGAREMSPNQIRQAWLPKGSKMFANSVGTAPGCAVPLPGGGQIIMLPGPPRELSKMLEEQARPYLLRLSNTSIKSYNVRTFGIGEGMAAHAISDLMAMANTTVAPYAHGGEMFVKITAKAANDEEAEKLCAPVIAETRKRLGNVVYGVDVPSLEFVVLNELMKREMTLATAESCTGGLLAKRITDLPGASKIFQLGLVTYSNEAKEKLLGIPTEMLTAYGAVSEEVARDMAENVRKLANASFGIGITGIAGPDGATAHKPVGLVHIALAGPDECFTRVMRPTGRYLGRDWTRERAASHALDMLRRHLAGLPLEF